jgi:hypothetical protein
MLAFGELEPVEVIGGFDDALFDATVGFFRARIMVPDLVAFGFAVFDRFMIGEEGGDFGVRGAMVGLESEEGMGSGEVDFPGDLFLAAHGVEGDGGAFHVDLAQQLGHGGDFVGLAID